MSKLLCMITAVLVGLVGAFALSFGVSVVVRSWAGRSGFVDRPARHKAHPHPVALGGGIALFVAGCLPLLGGTLLAWFMPTRGLAEFVPEFLVPHLPGIASKLPSVAAIVGCAFVLHVVGLVDDRKALGAWPKLAVQVGVALVTAGLMGIRLGEAMGTPLSIAATVIWLVVITNAFNFMDNMDGLSAGVAAVAAAIFAVTAGNAGQVFVPVTACIIVGACLGFLCFNFSPASLFMGDAGSLVLGYLMGVLTILTTFYDPRQGTTPVGLLVPVLVLAVPLYDVISVVIHRVRLGESPFRGDRRHFSHRLVNRGMSPRGAVLTIYLATAATGLPAILLPRIQDWPTALLILVQCVCVVLMIALLEHAGPKSKDP